MSPMPAIQRQEAILQGSSEDYTMQLENENGSTAVNVNVTTTLDLKLMRTESRDLFQNETDSQEMKTCNTTDQDDGSNATPEKVAFEDETKC